MNTLYWNKPTNVDNVIALCCIIMHSNTGLSWVINVDLSVKETLESMLKYI